MSGKVFAGFVLAVFFAAGSALVYAADRASSAEVRESSLNVMDFGAKGDAKADDTKAIQAALDALKGGKHGKLVIPAGNYRITETLK